MDTDMVQPALNLKAYLHTLRSLIPKDSMPLILPTLNEAIRLADIAYVSLYLSDDPKPLENANSVAKLAASMLVQALDSNTNTLT